MLSASQPGRSKVNGLHSWISGARTVVKHFTQRSGHTRASSLFTSLERAGKILPACQDCVKQLTHLLRQSSGTGIIPDPIYEVLDQCFSLSRKCDDLRKIYPLWRPCRASLLCQVGRVVVYHREEIKNDYCKSRERDLLV